MRVSRSGRWKAAAIVFVAALSVAAAQEKGPAPFDNPLEAPSPKEPPPPKASPQAKAGPKAKFEPRMNFEDESSAPALAPVEVPAPGPRLDHGFIGPRGTFHLYGGQGEASFLWPPDSKTPKFYREGLVYVSSESDGLVFQLTGRFYRAWFKLAPKPDSSGKYPVWVRNGARPWAPYQLAVVTPHAP